MTLLRLSDLKKLDMMGLRYRNIVSDVTGYLVFLEMDSLRTLDVGRSEVTRDFQITS